MLLYVGSYALIGRFRRRDREDLCSTDDDEVLVYKIRFVCLANFIVNSPINLHFGFSFRTHTHTQTQFVVMYIFVGRSRMRSTVAAHFYSQ